MSMEINIKRRLLIAGGLIALGLVVVYVLVYELAPFGDWANLLILNIITIVSAVSCAVISTLLLRFYESGEPPRRIWLNFTLFLWMWVAAEMIWTYYNMTEGDVPMFSAADVFWVIGYGFLTASLIRQFQLITFDRTRRPHWVGLAVWGIVLATVYIIATVVRDYSAGMLVSIFYPTADLFFGASALALVIAFRRGVMARPWMSLLVFVLADGLYIWATSTGAYEWVERSGLVTLMVEGIYVVAYLILAWGVFNQYLALKYGVTNAQKTIPQVRLKI